MNSNTLVLHDYSTKRWLHFESPRLIIEAWKAEEVIEKLSQVEEAVNCKGLYAAGFVSYESSPAFDPTFCVNNDELFPLLWFGLYDSPQEFNIRCFQTKTPPSPIPWTPEITSEQYQDSIKKIKQYIQRGETYQVNHTFRLKAPFPFEPWNYFCSFLAAHQPLFGGYLQLKDWAICSTSPELFFRLDNNLIESRPMKGTAARGVTFSEDIQQKMSLRNSLKNQAENVMIVDMVRNDLGRIAEHGSVSVCDLFAIEKYPTLWQMTSTVQAKTSSSITDIFKATFPPASITGAPKSRTMGIITELETSPRRLYTGCLGFIKPKRQAQFNVAIRTIVIDKRKKQAEYGVGGGIVWDSDTNAELQECWTKARVLTQPPTSFFLIETLLWTEAEGYWLLDKHLSRITQSAIYFDYSMNINEVQSQLKRAEKYFSGTDQKVRLLVAKNGSCTCQHEKLAEYTGVYPKPVALARSAMDTSNPFLYHKTSNRNDYQKVLAECPGFDEVIMYNEKGEVTEATTSNIVIELNSSLYTPPIKCGLLAGTYRANLIEQGKIQEKILTVDQVVNSRKLFLINSVRGMNRATLVQE